MPNEGIDENNIEALEKYRSYTRYYKLAEEEGKKPRWWRTYKEYLLQDQDTETKIDIGLPYNPPSRRKELRERVQRMKQNRRSPELERASRLKTLQIPLHDVRAEWERTSGPLHLQRVAEHYGIYRDLFDSATFVPRVPLRIEYSQNQEWAMPVYHGNVVTPSEALNPPQVSFDADEGSLWTLLLTNPDGHLRETHLEYVHWLVGNIPGNQILSGEEVCHYFPPFPAKGTGHHRHIFILFKQDHRIDFRDDVRPTPCHSLRMRTFKTLDFYRKHQDDMTPAGLAFFQCQWEESVTYIYHKLLNMKEPIFEFEHPPEYHPPQVKYPHGQPLRYLDRYRDSEEPTYGIY
ncbi:large ribosomal subunit protein mL38 isoform X2 [Ambystoma mexicanum]